jgi:DNA polymerase I
MRHIIFELAADSRYPVAILIKGAAFNQHALQTNYVDPLMARGIAKNQVIAFTLNYNSDNKAPAKLIKGYLESLLPAVNSLGVKYLYCADGNYFKTLTKKTKAEPYVGYAVPCAIEGYEHLQVVLGLNYQALVYDPNQLPKLVMGLEVLAGTFLGTHQQLGANIIKHAEYPEKLSDIAAALAKLHQYPELACDIEGFSLEFDKCGIGSIAFAWNKHEGLGFLCDYRPFNDPNDVLETGLHGYQLANPEVRALLLKFFTEYKGSLTFHNACFDVRVLIYYLWMQERQLDRESLLKGLDIMYRDLHDTKIIAYLATNNTAGNELSLKKQAHEFAGNYAQDDEDIKDIRRIPPKELLKYNVVDCLATWFVREKRWPTLVADRQLDIYTHLFLPSLKVITQMELVGMPMTHTRIMEAKAQLEAQEKACLDLILNHPLIKLINLLLTEAEWKADYEGRKAKAKNPEKIQPKDRGTFPVSKFNPNSGPQLQRLLYEVMALPVIDLTDSKQPATGADTLKKLLNHCHSEDHKEIINALRDYSKVTKILTAFIPAFEKALDKGDGRVWLHGSFNLGGTVSGRLSSSKPNLQQIPANSTFGKLIKSCFAAPNGWLFVGADFNSLTSSDFTK